MRKLGKIDLESHREATISASSRGSHARSSEESHIGEKSEGQELQETALSRNQKVRLPVVDKSGRSVLQRMKRSSDHCIVVEPLLLACTKP